MNSTTFTLNNQNIAWVVFFAVAISLTAVALSVWYAPNVPFLDDYHLCLDFLNEFVASGNGIPTLFEKRNGHFFITQKLIFILDFILFGKVDFRHFVIVNNIVFVSIFYFIYCILRHVRIDQIHFITLLFVGCVPNWYLNNHSSSFLHFSSVLFCLLTFLWLNRKTSRTFTVASFFAILAALSSGGGLLVYFAALPLVWRGFRRSYRYLWLLQFLMLTVLYLLASDSGSGGDFSKIFSVSYWVILSGNFFLFYGSFFKPLYSDYHVWSIIIGVGGILGLTYLFWNKRKLLEDQPLLLSGLLMGILLGIASAIMRSQYGLGATTSDRYRLYQFIFWAFSYLILVSAYEIKLNRWYPWILVGAVLFFGLRMKRSMAEIQFRYIQLLEGMKYYQTFGAVGQLTYRDQSTAGKILERSAELGVYSMMDQKVDLYLDQVDLDNTETVRFTIELRTVRSSNDLMHMEGWVHPEVIFQDRHRILVFVDGKGGRVYYQTGPIITAASWLPLKDNSFSVTVEGRSAEERVGVAIYRRGKGVIGEQFVDLKSR